MVAVIPVAYIDVPENAPSALINEVVVPAVFCPSNKLVTLSALPVPFLIDTLPKIELIVISGSEELLYACCKVVVATPPAAPTVSPNFDVKKNHALEVSLKSVAVLKTDNTPIKIPLFVKLLNVLNCSVAIPSIAADN